MSTHSLCRNAWVRTTLATGLLCAAISAVADTGTSDLLPKVRLSASDPVALVGTSSGAFTLVRTGTNGDLTIDLEVGGTAVGGTDYQSISNQLTIPAGSVAIDIPVQPLPGAPASARDKTVILTLKSSTNYTIWSRKSAEVELAEQLYNNQKPVVSITSPTNGAVISGALVTVTATASDAEEAIAKVSFFAGDDLIGTSTNAPYSITWTNATSGKHILFAKAVDTIGQVGLSPAVTITVTNGIGRLSITSPADGASLPPGNVTITADAGGNSSVTSVNFIANGHLLGTASQAPFTFVWSNAVPGHYELQATSGSKGNELRSEPVDITIKDTPPAVTLTAPTNNATFGPSAGIVFSADATAGDEPIQRVSFWVDERLVGVATNAPYTTTWSDPQAGRHIAVAWAVDTFGVTARSAQVKFTVTNTPPTVTLTSPADNATFTAPAQITIAADAADSDGLISRVTFWANNRLIGVATKSPYSVTWSHVPAGQYAIEAHAVDNSGASTASAPIVIVVNRK